MKKLFLTNEKDQYIEIVELLGYQKIKEKESIFKGYSAISFKKRNNNPLDIMFINEHMPKSMVPFFFVIFFIALTIILSTLFLIFSFINKDINTRFIYFLSLMVPSLLSLLMATSITFLRYYVTFKNMRVVASKALIIKEYEKYECSSGR